MEGLTVIGSERIDIYPALALVDIDSVQDYVDVLNGIMLSCHHGGYREGNRNEIAVDLTVASHMLGMDALEILNLFIRHGLIQPRLDDESPTARVTRVLGYDARFDWDYMISSEYYRSLGHDMGAYHDEIDCGNIPFLFVVSHGKEEQLDLYPSFE